MPRTNDKTSATYQRRIFAAADAQGDSAEFPGLLSCCGVRRSVAPGTAAWSWMLGRRTANSDAADLADVAAVAGTYCLASASCCRLFGGLSVRIVDG